MTKICIELYNGKKMYADLYEEIAPKTVANINLLIDKGFYKGIVFHRIIKGFMCQCGGYVVDEDTLKAVKNPTLEVTGEFKANGIENNLHHGIGVLSLARTNDMNSGSTQFFICTADDAFLDGNYAAFGRLSDFDSLDVLMTLDQIPTSNIGAGFENFPSGDRIDFTIKDIYRV